jgi:hypothetical protein
MKLGRYKRYLRLAIENDGIEHWRVNCEALMKRMTWGYPPSWFDKSQIPHATDRPDHYGRSLVPPRA